MFLHFVVIFCKYEELFLVKYSVNYSDKIIS